MNEKIRFKESLERQKSPLDKKAKKKYRNLKFLLAGIILGYYSLLVAAIFHFRWDKMEQYTFILSVIPLVISMIYLLMAERTINPVNYLMIQREQYLQRIYKEFDFEIAKLNETDDAIANRKRSGTVAYESRRPMRYARTNCPGLPALQICHRD